MQLSLSDFFFQHQRGLVLGIYVLATSVGTFLGPLVSGYITDNPTLGWRWVGWFAVIISGTLFVVFYFGLEETVFDRKDLDGSQAVTSFSTRTIETVKVSDVQRSRPSSAATRVVIMKMTISHRSLTGSALHLLHLRQQ